MKSNIYGAVREGQLVSSAVVSTIGENQFSDGQFKGATVTSAADDPVNGLTTGDFGFTQSVVGGGAP
jgi:hypothetical protein